MRECWARALGGCGGGLSGEHPISKRFFKGTRAVLVGGRPYRSFRGKPIGINSLTIKVLCRDHNSALSPVDTAAGNMFLAIHEYHQGGAVFDHDVWGPYLERFFVKAAISCLIMHANDVRWPGGAALTSPPEYMLKAAFGIEPLKEPCGLFIDDSAPRIGPPGDGRGLVSFDSALDEKAGEYLGALFELHTIPFQIWFSYGSVPPWVVANQGQFYRSSGVQIETGPRRFDLRIKWASISN